MSELESEPDPPEYEGLNNLENGLATGDVKEVVRALRALVNLDPSASKSAVALLADVFEDNPSLHHRFPWRLKFARRGRGRPRRDQMQQGADRVVTGRIVEEELLKSPKVDLAIEKAGKRLKRGKTTIYGREARRKAKESK